MSYQSYNTSSAYKLDNPEREIKKTQTAKKPNLKKKVNKKKIMVRKVKGLSMVAAVIVLSFMMVRGYVAIDEMNGNITKLKKEHSSVVAENQVIQAEINKNLDLEELQRAATEEYNMTRPERYQVFYIDMGFGDTGVHLAENENEKEIPSLSGASGMLVDSMNIFD
ncbi:MAG: septum formation initiator family protein [Clostridia bacterium]|nr:septum formation initiator family protein [Clostridia bacterium]